MAVLATWAPEDAVLGAVAPLALALAAGTCLVVRLDGVERPRGDLTLARLVADGPRSVDLSPRRRGVAVLSNGGVGLADAAEVVDALVAGWPAVVLAGRTGPERPLFDGVVPVVLDAPGAGSPLRGPRVVQCLMRRRPRTESGVVALPPVGRATIRELLEGRTPGPTAWMRAWREVWEARWV